MVATVGDILGDAKQQATATDAQIGPSDTQTYFEIPVNSINGYLANIRIDTKSIIGSCLFWGNTTYGIWGSFYWSSTYPNAPVRIVESKLYSEQAETFLTTTKKDTFNSSVSGWGSGSVVFFLGQVNTSLASGSASSSIGTSVGSIQLN